MKKSRLFALLFLISCSAFGQKHDFQYSRAIHGIQDQWHSLEIPNDMQGKLNKDGGDLRLYGVKADNDTVEAPYLFRILQDETTVVRAPFELLNLSENDQGYYYTMRLNEGSDINRMDLRFGQENFDWRVKIEGSHNQLEWFTLVDDYRILSIVNSEVRYDYRKVVLPRSNYTYYRLFVPSSENPYFLDPYVKTEVIKAGKWRNYKVTHQSVHQDEASNETTIDIDLEHAVFIDRVVLGVSDEFDYYRQVVVEFLEDSTVTEKKTLYHYQQMGSGILSSLESGVIDCDGRATDQVRIRIQNHDNEPLHIEEVRCSGYVRELVARFTEPADYFLAYGNEQVSSPQYDIARFTKNIPDNLGGLTLGPEQENKKEASELEKGLFDDPYWLWGTLLVVIAVMGWFTLRMMRGNKG